MSDSGQGLWDERSSCLLLWEPAGVLPTEKGAGWRARSTRLCHGGAAGSRTVFWASLLPQRGLIVVPPVDPFSSSSIPHSPPRPCPLSSLPFLSLQL